MVLVAGLSSWVAAQEGAPQEVPVYDEVIRVTHSEKLIYPLLAQRARVQGVVVVRAKIDEKGRVVSAIAVSGNRILIPDCLSNSKQWRFQPTVSSDVVIVYDFRLTNIGCKSPCASEFTFRLPNIATISTGSPFVNP